MSTQPTNPVISDPQVGDAASIDGEVVEMASFRASRYERKSCSLPHLADDPDWTPATFDLLSPIANEAPKRWFDRFRN